MPPHKFCDSLFQSKKLKLSGGISPCFKSIIQPHQFLDWSNTEDNCYDGWINFRVPFSAAVLGNGFLSRWHLKMLLF